ncbi:sigma-70 family RNA polymerase sigma factor [soil metagenome]
MGKHSPTTRASLLVRIRDARDTEAWGRFVDLYAPLIYGFARRRGLQDADAADLTQEVLGSVASAARRLEYDPARGSFRSWLFTVVRHEFADALAARARRERASGDPADHRRLDQQPADVTDESEVWEREYEQHLFRYAADQIRVDFEDNTWQAFWKTAVEGQAPREVSEALGMSIGAVYIAKSRVLARLRDTVQELRED